MSEWAEREAEIREILSGNASPAAVRVEAAAYDLLARLDQERRARSASEHAWADERDLMKRERDELRIACDGCADAMYKTGRAHYDDCPVRVVVRERDEARAALVGLREAADRIAAIAIIPYSDKGNAASNAYNDAIHNTRAVADAYRAQRRAEALREAADTLDKHRFDVGSPPTASIARWLRALADKGRAR